MSNQKSKSPPYRMDPAENRKVIIQTCQEYLRKDFVLANLDYHLMLLNTLGHTLLASGDFSKAAECYVKTLEIDPCDNQAHWGLREINEKDAVLQRGLRIPELA